MRFHGDCIIHEAVDDLFQRSTKNGQTSVFFLNTTKKKSIIQYHFIPSPPDMTWHTSTSTCGSWQDSDQPQPCAGVISSRWNGLIKSWMWMSYSSSSYWIWTTKYSVYIQSSANAVFVFHHRSWSLVLAYDKGSRSGQHKSWWLRKQLTSFGEVRWFR